MANCFYCNTRFGRDPLSRDCRTVDHIVPIAVGGIKIGLNEILACKLCNNARGTMRAEKYLRLVFARGRRGAAEYAFSHRRKILFAQHAWAKSIAAMKQAGTPIDCIVADKRRDLFACRYELFAVPR